MTVSLTSSASDDAAAILDDRARSLARPVATGLAATELHVIVRVGPSRLAVPAARARHVTGPQPLAALPAGGEPVVGVTPILGQIVAVVDLATLLGITSDLSVSRRPLLVVDDGDELLAMLVDDVETLTAVDASSAGVGPGDVEPGALVRDVGGTVRVLQVDAVLEVLPTLDADRATSHSPGAEP